MRLIQRDGSAAAPTVDRTLVKAIVQGRNWWRELQANTAQTIEDLARREGLTAAYVVRIVRLAFLSPAVLKSVIDGTLPAHLTIKRLTAPDAVPVRWDR
jgi:site-specific DNA recombinase